MYFLGTNLGHFGPYSRVIPARSLNYHWIWSIIFQTLLVYEELAEIECADYFESEEQLVPLLAEENVGRTVEQAFRDPFHGFSFQADDQI